MTFASKIRRTLAYVLRLVQNSRKKNVNTGPITYHGRLEDVILFTQEIRNPVILPRDHPLVQLLLRYLHEKRGHCGYKKLNS